MQVIFYKKGSPKHFAISYIQHCDSKQTHVCITNEEGEGGQFNADEVVDVIYEALEKYFNEKY